MAAWACGQHTKVSFPCSDRDRTCFGVLPRAHGTTPALNPPTPRDRPFRPPPTSCLHLSEQAAVMLSLCAEWLLRRLLRTARGRRSRSFRRRGPFGGPSPSSSASSGGIGNRQCASARSNARPDGPRALLTLTSHRPHSPWTLRSRSSSGRRATTASWTPSYWLLAAGRAALRPAASQRGIAAASVGARLLCVCMLMLMVNLCGGATR